MQTRDELAHPSLAADIRISAGGADPRAHTQADRRARTDLFGAARQGRSKARSAAGTQLQTLLSPLVPIHHELTPDRPDRPDPRQLRLPMCQWTEARCVPAGARLLSCHRNDARPAWFIDPTAARKVHRSCYPHVPAVVRRSIDYNARNGRRGYGGRLADRSLHRAARRS